MKVVILTAMDKELSLVLNILENPKEDTIDGNKIYRGKSGIHEVILAKCGIGKVNAAVKTFSIISHERPELVINSGVAGGAGLPVGATLVADKVAYDDVWCGPGTEFGQADGCPLFFSPHQIVIDKAKECLKDANIHYGLICSGDTFISSPEEIAFIRSKFPQVKAVDMESASIAQVCFLTNTPFSIVRVVSDTPGEGENISQYKDFWKTAPEKTFETVKALINNLDL